MCVGGGGLLVVIVRGCPVFSSLTFSMEFIMMKKENFIFWLEPKIENYIFGYCFFFDYISGSDFHIPGHAPYV